MRNIDDRMIREGPDGRKWVLQNRWLRLTSNPVAPGYPRTGDEIELKSHSLVPDGKHIVEQVTEFEPGVDRDEDGRDIRISLLGIGKDFNGKNILAAMEKAKDARDFGGRSWKDQFARPFRKLFNFNRCD